MEFHHYSVLLNETIENLNIRPDGIYVDGTLGGGGHSYQILKRLGENGRLIGIDQDADAIQAAGERLAEFGNKATLIRSNYANMKEELHAIGVNGVDGIVLDLGVSSFQLDTLERGFTYREPDAPLDMRMDPTRGLSAAEWLMKAEEEDIAWVLKTFGEERFAKRIARAIVERNRLEPMTRTHELATLIANASPFREKHKHPATRSFQAIRIYINSELEEIERALNGALEILSPEGRLSVISFHSLEDRIVKQFIRHHSRGPQVPAGIPLTEAQLRSQGGRKLKALGKMKPSSDEVSANPRARSSVLRFAERTVE